MIRVARELRRNQTKSEMTFWNLVRNRKLLGFKFLRQHIIKMKYEGKTDFFVADFYCAEKKLVIEIDGEIHNNQEEHDELRTQLLGEKGIKVIRIKNEEINDKDLIINRIKKFLI